MANLNLIYEESGLQGILPYAFGMAGSGYEFLCSKLMEGEQFFVIVSNSTGFPFFFADAGKTFFCLYSSEDMAEAKCDTLARDRYKTEYAPLNSADWTDRLWPRYRDLGITHICMDDSIWVRIADLAPAAQYDGFLSPAVPLRNARLNAALYLLTQELESDQSSLAVEAYFWQVLTESHFYVPVRPLRPLSAGESLSADNMELHRIQAASGKEAVLVFTDGDFMAAYANAQGLSKDEWTAAYTPSFQDLLDFMEEDSSAIILNAGLGSFYFDLELFGELEGAALNQGAAEAAARRG